MYISGELVLNSYLNESNIQIVNDITNWEKAIEMVCNPLIKNKKITESYQRAIIKTTKEIGPYYVLGPKIAMPHARPEDGVISNALSLLIVRNGINFNSQENDPVKVILLLAAQDSDQHINLITSISEFFCCEDDIKSITTAINKTQVLNILNKY